MERINSFYFKKWKNDGSKHLSFIALLLSYSHYRIYQVSLSKNQDVLFSLLDQAFKMFGRVPKEIVTDNLKTLMEEARTSYQTGKINERFQQFAKENLKRIGSIYEND
ncbi:MAG: hypothetical protein KH020_19530 [Clostridiales bacterium]|nr:hypothetical protein [Clostridiales bacterium]